MDAIGKVGASDAAEAVAAGIMEDFAERTGLTSPRPQVRYLWTDAFAVCNYLTLRRRTGEERYAELATLLIDGVHHVLGRHREDDARSGWISGLDEGEGERHPTAGGLRIGKRLNERGPRDPYDPRLEWDRDGQYYHYLVRWMHALGRAGGVLGDDRYLLWAVELAQAAHAGFVYQPGPGEPRHMRWKMSIDLTYPLVPSEGAHDPLDGFVTTCALGATLPGRLLPQVSLDRQVTELGQMCTGRRWVTDDPLGVGGLLMDACWVAGLLGVTERVPAEIRSLSPGLWRDALSSLVAVARGYPFDAGTSRRLAFRELGLAIGLRGVDLLLRRVEPALDDVTRSACEDATRFQPLAQRVLATWLQDGAREEATWKDHEDINAVMLATALAPDEYLAL